MIDLSLFKIRRYGFGNVGRDGREPGRVRHSSSCHCGCRAWRGRTPWPGGDPRRPGPGRPGGGGLARHLSAAIGSTMVGQGFGMGL